MLHSHHKAHRLEADLSRMAEVLALIVRLAENRPAPMTNVEALAHIAKLGRAGLAGATPAAETPVQENA